MPTETPTPTSLTQSEGTQSGRRGQVLEGNRRQQFPADCAIIVYRHTATLVTDTTAMARQLQGCTFRFQGLAVGVWGPSVHS